MCQDEDQEAVDRGRREEYHGGVVEPSRRKKMACSKRVKVFMVSFFT